MDKSLESRLLLEVADDYKRIGYDVLMHPAGDDLPDFLSGFRLDMIAYGSEENVVVEVKTRQMLAGVGYLPTMADKINTTPGWRLDLVVVNPLEDPVRYQQDCEG